ncbi:nuclear transport factor 2 family protein [Thiobacillus denitrificans]|nr:nuclear transport factor 2 family protein [Thiobacillus denitrificans]
MTYTSSDRQVIELERGYWQALKDKDIDAVLSMTDDPCIVSGAQGVAEIDHKTFEQMMRSAPWTIDAFSLGDDVHVRMLSEDVAVVAYKVHEELSVEGKPLTLDAADSSTWVRRGGRWLCAAHSEALAGDAYGRDRRSAG